MTIPKNRKEFERHLDILVEKVQLRKFRIPPSRRVINSLLNIKELPNRRINIHTINESARLLANSLAHFDKTKIIKEEDDEQ
jgi:hypothetical protein